MKQNSTQNEANATQTKGLRPKTKKFAAANSTRSETEAPNKKSCFAKQNSIWLESVPDQQKYPPLKNNLQVDIAIIGGGIVGIMTAYHLANKGLSVALLEKNHLVTGDTGLTTGFLSRVPDTSFHYLQQKYGADFLRKIFAAARQTQLNLFQLIQEKNIACDFQKCTSYFGSYQSQSPILAKEFEAVKDADSDAALIDSSTHPSSSGFPFQEAIEFKNEGKLNIRKFLFGLLDLIKNEQLHIFEETEVIDIEVQNLVKIKTAGPVVTAKKLIVAMGNTNSLFPELDILFENRITHVIAVEYDHPPLTEDIFWDTFDPYFYFRKVGEKNIIVGGCDRPGKKPPTENPSEKLKKILDERLRGNYEMTNEWAGSILHTADGLPYIFAHPHYQEKILIALGFGGNGLMFGTLAANILANQATANCPLSEKITAITGPSSDEIKNYLELFKPERTGSKIRQPLKKMNNSSGVKKFVFFANVSEFKGKNKLCKTIEGKSIAVFKAGENFSAINNICSHAGGSLCDGDLEENIIQCPLHGAKFDVISGKVMGPPAIRPQQKYNLKKNGENLEIEIETAASTSPTALISPTQIPLSSTANPKSQKHWRAVLKFSAASIIFWFIQFALQYWWLSRDELGAALTRSFAFTGTTLIGLALFSSAIFKWFPKNAIHWRLRRYMGVSGFVFGFFHVLTVLHFYFNYDLSIGYYSFNPLENPIIFGSISFPIFLVMALTSTDWAVNKLTPKVWKFIHRFVYVAYITLIFHFALINTPILNSPPGYLLILVTIGALFGQVFWFFKTAAKRKFKSLGTVVGLSLIVGTLIVAYLVYRQNFST